jgi:hypothetical protein
LLYTCSNNTRPKDLLLVYNSFNSNTKLYDSGRFKEGKVLEECKVEEESLGNKLNTYLARDNKYKLNSRDEGAASSKGAIDNNKEVTDFKGFSN